MPGPDGALWFTEAQSNKIGRITTTSAISEYPIPTLDTFPNGMAAGPDGALWFTESNTPNIGRITTSGVITEYPLPAGYCTSQGITPGPDGALWFTDGCNDVGRITTAGAVTEFQVTVNRRPLGITSGPDGALWFVESNISNLGRITTTGAWSEFPANAMGSAITTGTDGQLWFTEPHSEIYASSIGEALFVTANLSVNPPTVYYGSRLTFTGSGFAPQELVNIYRSGVGSAVLASATADSSGSFTATARMPPSDHGPRIFAGVGQASAKLGAANCSVMPLVVLHPNAGPAGTIVTVEGYGFDGIESLNIVWKAPQTVLGKTTVNTYGTFNGSAALTFTVPTGSAPGRNAVDVFPPHNEEFSVGAHATFTVQ